MPGIVFLHPGLWPCFLALCVPIVLHLLTRRARTTVALPTFVFLKRSLANQSRIYRVRRPLLLLLRLAALFFLALAFLKPITRAPLGQPGGNGRAMVIVLDRSLSMGYTRAGVSSLAHVRAPMVQMLEDLKTGDRANVVFADARPHSVLPTAGDDFATLVEAVQSATPTLERANLSAALAEAIAQLNRAHSAQGELVLASDFQATNGKGVDLKRIPAGVDLVLLNAASSPRENAGIMGLTLDSSAPRPGEATNLTVEVWNGASSSRTLSVTLDVRADRDGEIPADRGPARKPLSVLVPPFASGMVRLPWTFPVPGRYLVTAHLPGDALKADDARFLVVDVKRASKVLLLTDENVRPGAGSYYLDRALEPDPNAPGDVEAIVKRPADLTASDLNGCGAVVWEGITDVSHDRLALLRRYISDGGALMVFLSSTQRPAPLRAFAALAPADSGLPFMPRAPFDAKGKGKGYLTLGEARYESPLLKVFQDPATADLGAAHFRRVWTTDRPNPNAEVLLRFDNGPVAAALCPLGAGVVLMCNFSAAPADGDLARQPIFPPMIHAFLKGMASKPSASLERYPGDTLVMPIAAREQPASVRAIAPSGQAEPVATGRASVVIRRAAQCGFYRFLAEGKTMNVVAVNPHPDETDLRSLDPKTLRGPASERRPFVMNSEPGALDRLDTLQHGRALWPYCLLAVMLLLIVEQAVSTAGARVR